MARGVTRAAVDVVRGDAVLVEDAGGVAVDYVRKAWGVGEAEDAVSLRGVS